jgi:membrane associated rhomboid family serine protease
METAIRASGRASEAEEWGLVLAAANIPYRVEPDGAGWALLVPAAEATRAQAVLDAYDEEAPRQPDATVPDGASPSVAWAVGVAAGALLLAFFALTGPPAPGSRWFAQGAAAARPMLSGEPWRAVTALTLHADTVHVAGNAVATAVLLAAVGQRLGVGCGLWLLLLAGAGGHLLAAMTRDPRHVAVGASTATFGAIGILAALRLLPTHSHARPRWKRWMVLAASLVLLTLLGTSPGTDILGHAFGLLAGGALGLAAGAALRRPPGPAVQWSLVALAALAVLACWHLALVRAAW